MSTRATKEGDGRAARVHKAEQIGGQAKLLEKELHAVDFSALAAGDELILWVQEIESDAGFVALPMLKIRVPRGLKKTRKAAIVDIIVQKLTQPLATFLPDDVFVFYQLLSVLALSPDDRFRSKLIRSFEVGCGVAVLPLLRIGTQFPRVNGVEPWDGESEDSVHVHKLVWIRG